jgi:hypothetical protein
VSNEPEQKPPTTVQEAADQAAEARRRAVEAGELRAGTEGGVPDPRIQPGTGTVTDPIPGARQEPTEAPPEPPKSEPKSSSSSTSTKSKK